jgi:hypothetical protein
VSSPPSPASRRFVPHRHCDECGARMTRGGAYWVRPPSSPFGLPLVSLLPPSSSFILLIDIFPVYLRCVHFTLNSSEYHPRPPSPLSSKHSLTRHGLLTGSSTSGTGWDATITIDELSKHERGHGRAGRLRMYERRGALALRLFFARSQRPHASLSRTLPTTLSRPRRPCCLRFPRERPCPYPHRARARHLQME